jgi:hypothetical protein
MRHKPPNHGPIPLGNGTELSLGHRDVGGEGGIARELLDQASNPPLPASCSILSLPSESLALWH